MLKFLRMTRQGEIHEMHRKWAWQARIGLTSIGIDVLCAAICLVGVLSWEDQMPFGSFLPENTVLAPTVCMVWAVAFLVGLLFVPGWLSDEIQELRNLLINYEEGCQILGFTTHEFALTTEEQLRFKVGAELRHRANRVRGVEVKLGGNISDSEHFALIGEWGSSKQSFENAYGIFLGLDLIDDTGYGIYFPK